MSFGLIHICQHAVALSSHTCVKVQRLSILSFSLSLSHSRTPDWLCCSAIARATWAFLPSTVLYWTALFFPTFLIHSPPPSCSCSAFPFQHLYIELDRVFLFLLNDDAKTISRSSNSRSLLFHLFWKEEEGALKTLLVDRQFWVQFSQLEAVWKWGDDNPRRWSCRFCFISVFQGGFTSLSSLTQRSTRADWLCH